MMNIDPEAQASALTTADQLARLVERRDRLNEAIDDASGALVAQVARTRWSRRQMVELWELARRAKVTHLGQWIIEAMSTSVRDLKVWQAMEDPDCLRDAGWFPVEAGHPLPRKGTAVVYLLLGLDGRCLYVGCSENVRERFKQHKKAGRVPMIRYEVIECDSRATALQLEADLIFQHQPAHNTAGTRNRMYVSQN